MLETFIKYLIFYIENIINVMAVTTYKNKYLVFDDARIVRLEGDYPCCKCKSGNDVHLSTKEIKQSTNKNGYKQCCLFCGKTQYVHHIVWEAFCGKILDGMEIDHIDTDRGNNNLSNLRLVSKKENRNNPLTKEHYRISNKGKFTEKLREINRERCLDPKRNPNRYLGNY